MTRFRVVKAVHAARIRAADVHAAARRLRASTQGVAAVEAAFILPILLTLFLAGSEATTVFDTSRKLVLLSRTLGDITGQLTTITASGMATIFGASASVLQPYPTTDLDMVVSSILVEQGSGNTVKGTVAWSCAQGPNAGSLKRSAGSTYAPPVGYQTPGTSFILAEVKMPYKPRFGSGAIKADIPLSETTPWPVRNPSPVAWSGSAC